MPATVRAAFILCVKPTHIDPSITVALVPFTTDTVFILIGKATIV